MIEQLIKQFVNNETEALVVQQARHTALQTLEKLGLPTTKNENWKYTALTSLINNHFVLPASIEKEEVIDIQKIRSLLNEMNVSNSYSIIFYNGQLIPELSDTTIPGVHIESLGQFLQHATHEELELVFKQDINHSDESFVLLNHSFVQHGVFLRVAAQVKLDKPIRLLYVGADVANLVVNYKNIIQLDEQSELTVIEEYIADNHNQQQFTNVVNQLTLADNACLSHYRLQHLNANHFHINRTAINQHKSSYYHLFGLDCGGRLVRNDLITNLMAHDAHCDLKGVYLQNTRSHVDNHIVVNHRASNCSSNQTYKGIIADRSRAVFNGRVLVEPKVIATDAKQQNDNLLLSAFAEIDTKPELEIYADDVQCSHGCTVGQLDSQQLFYLRSRGIDTISAKKMLTQAFCCVLLECINNPNVQAYIEQLVHTKLQRMTQSS